MMMMMNKVPDNNCRRIRPSASSSTSTAYLLCMIKNFTPSKIHTYFTIFLLLYILFITKENNNYFNATNTNTEYDNNISAVKSVRKADLITVLTTSTIKFEQQKEEPTRSRREPPRLGDGCYNIFIDVGANVGVHGRFLFEPDKYPNSLSSVQLFRNEYGEDSTRNNADYCVFEIEANPKHWKRLDTISNAYKTYNKGWKYHVIKAAASDQNGNMTFYHQGVDDNNNNEWGFSNVHDYKKSNQSELYKKAELSSVKKGNVNIKINTTNASIEVVPAIRLSEWIQYHILERTIPKLPPSYGTTNAIQDPNKKPINIKPPILGMKIDIEGSEYIVLPDLIHSNIICSFNFVFGEYHSWFAPIEKSHGHRVSLKSVKEILEYEWAITKIIESSRNCLVRWLKSDDETYLHDGIPLPLPLPLPTY
jgi:hypothetical protein